MSAAYERRQLVAARNQLLQAVDQINLALTRPALITEGGFRAAFARERIRHADTLLRRYVKRSGALA